MLCTGFCSTYGRKTISATRTSGLPAPTYSLSLRGRLYSSVHAVDRSTGSHSELTTWAEFVNLHRRLLVVGTFSLSSSLPMAMTNENIKPSLRFAEPDRRTKRDTGSGRFFQKVSPKSDDEDYESIRDATVVWFRPGPISMPISTGEEDEHGDQEVRLRGYTTETKDEGVADRATVISAQTPFLRRRCTWSSTSS